MLFFGKQKCVPSNAARSKKVMISTSGPAADIKVMISTSGPAAEVPDGTDGCAGKS